MTGRVNCRLGCHRNKIVRERSLSDMTEFCLECIDQTTGHATEPVIVLCYFSSALKNVVTLREFQGNMLIYITEHFSVT